MSKPKSLKWILEDQAFSPSYNLAHPPHSPSRHQVGSLPQSSFVSHFELTDGSGVGGRGKEPNNTTARKPLDLNNPFTITTLWIRLSVHLLHRPRFKPSEAKTKEWLDNWTSPLLVLLMTLFPAAGRASQQRGTDFSGRDWLQLCHRMLQNAGAKRYVISSHVVDSLKFELFF
jgi:hypothetical protein